MNYEETFYGCSMTMKRQDIRENWRHITRPTVVCQKLCERLWNLPTIQDRSKPFPSFLFTHSWSSYNSTVCKLLYGFHYGSTLVVVDQGLSKGVILCPCTKTITSDDTAQLLLDNLYKRFGLPDKIISDRGPQFAAKAFRELLKLLGITSSLTTAYHPQSDGATERVNQEIEAYLS